MGECTFCGFGLYHPIDAKFEVASAGLYDDARFPGRAILMLKWHQEDLETLEPDTLGQFWRDAARLGRAVKQATGAAKINYAVLGNAEPHLHVHIVPRFPDEEQFPTRSPWNDPRPLETLDPVRLKALQQQLIDLLARQP